MNHLRKNQIMIRTRIKQLIKDEIYNGKNKMNQYVKT